MHKRKQKTSYMYSEEGIRNDNFEKVILKNKFLYTNIKKKDTIV